MAEKRETLFRRKIVAELRRLPHIIIFSIQQIGIRGTPDLLISLCGIFIAIEIKAEDGVRSQLQKYNIRRINANGGHGFFVDPDNWKETKDFLKQLSKTPLINQGETV